MKFFRSEKGQVMVMTLLAMTVLMGFMALAIDTGLLFRSRRNMQIAADAAAMTGAMEAFYKSDATLTDVQNAAYAAAKANGVDQSASGNTVKVSWPPADGANKGCGSCVEAQVGMPSSTLFMQLFSTRIGGSNFGSISVGARAVAGAPAASKACVWLVDPKMDSELALKGKGAITATNCAIYVNSDSASAVYYNGNTSVNASSLQIVGNDTAAMGLDPGHVQVKVAAQSPNIPLDLGNISPGACTQTSSATEIYPAGNAPKNPKSTQVSDSSVSGTATNNIVCFSKSVTLDDGVVLPGVLGNGVLYVFNNGVSLGGAATFGNAPPPVNGKFDPTQTTGATLDIAGGSFSQGNGSLSIYAPTSGTYNSIALMQPATNVTDNHCPASPGSPCLLIQRGNSNSTFDGIIYAPGEYVELQDQAGAVYATGLIAKGLFNKTSNMYINNYSSYNPTTTPFKLVSLVE